MKCIPLLHENGIHGVYKVRPIYIFNLIFLYVFHLPYEMHKPSDTHGIYGVYEIHMGYTLGPILLN